MEICNSETTMHIIEYQLIIILCKKFILNCKLSF